ncbi:hypothetical protein NPIL_297701 [Nephila pilipes]|uniref:Uncharacterized protein n=1 Tax=Nephila pilipes TaxID=299642 RepID=A0A8X6JIG9_NEPPI|nr:hypothetical protein NPIL_297701 [Nephila pilipes]
MRSEGMMHEFSRFLAGYSRSCHLNNNQIVTRIDLFSLRKTHHNPLSVELLYTRIQLSYNLFAKVAILVANNRFATTGPVTESNNDEGRKIAILSVEVIHIPFVPKRCPTCRQRLRGKVADPNPVSKGSRPLPLQMSLTSNGR